MDQVGLSGAGDGGERFDLFSGVADPKRVERVYDVDQPGSAIGDRRG